MIEKFYGLKVDPSERRIWEYKDVNPKVFRLARFKAEQVYREINKINLKNFSHTTNTRYFFFHWNGFI